MKNPKRAKLDKALKSIPNRKLSATDMLSEDLAERIGSLDKRLTRTIADRLFEHTDIEVPYHVWTCFGEKAQSISLAGNQASLGEDYHSLTELRKAIEWYVGQLGGNVKWSK
jgi:hypothetical protein